MPLFYQVPDYPIIHLPSPLGELKGGFLFVGAFSESAINRTLGKRAYYRKEARCLLSYLANQQKKDAGRYPFKVSGWRWIRTTEGVSQQIYSLPHLATLVSTLSEIISMQI